MFEPFYQEHRDDTSIDRGSGLGLAITKKLVDTMGGTIDVDSEIGCGTTFTIDLLCDYIPASDLPMPREANTAIADSYHALRGKRILLCEDHPLNREIAEMLLKQRGMTVDVAVNGRDAVDQFCTSPLHHYSLVLMDVRMPVMDGLEATTVIRKLPRDDARAIPIVALTANAFAEDIQKCINAGMNAHIAKPIDPNTLYQTMASFIK